MKVALVHDYIKEYGGAERVLEALHEIWPNAPIYTSVYLPSFLGPHKERFRGWDIKTSWVQNLPFKSKLISPLRLISSLVFDQFDFSKYDVVIVSATGAYSPNVINKKKAIQICYSHTPPRYLYGFETARDWKSNSVTRILGAIAIHFLRMVDFSSSQNVDFFVANSKNVQSRIEKFYRKESTVIYPPVDLGSKIAVNKKGDYYLAGGRIARPKHIDLIVETFAKLNLPLKVFGRKFAGPDILFKKYPNIEFVGEISDSDKKELMKNAKAFVFAAEDEDFGITPVESISFGTPVIAYKSGGTVETVVENPSAGSGSATGMFFDNLTTESLSKTVKEFEKESTRKKFNKDFMVRYASKFSRDRFKKEILEFVNSRIKK